MLLNHKVELEILFIEKENTNKSDLILTSNELKSWTRINLTV